MNEDIPEWASEDYDPTTEEAIARLPSLEDELLALEIAKSDAFYNQLERPERVGAGYMATDYRAAEPDRSTTALQDRTEERISFPVTDERGPVPVQDQTEERVTIPPSRNYTIIDMPTDVGRGYVPIQDRTDERIARPRAEPPAPTPPRAAPAAAPAEPQGFFARAFSGKDYQSDGRPVVINGQVNWGDPQNPADFVRANAAMMDMLSGAGSSASRAGGSGGAGRAMSYAPAPSGGMAASPALRAIKMAESGGDPNAKNPRSSAGGLYQFTDGTWGSVLRRMNPNVYGGYSDRQLKQLKGRPEIQEAAARFHMDNDIIPTLTRNGIEPTPGNLYLAWFQGPTGAVRAYRAPADATVAQVFPETVQANANMRFNGKPYAAWTMNDLRAFTNNAMARRMRADGGRLLQDEFPTSYLPHVGRQVMNNGGETNFEDFVLSKLEPFELDAPKETKKGVELTRKEVMEILNRRTSGDERDPHMPSSQDSLGAEDMGRIEAVRSGSSDGPNVAPLSAKFSDKEEARGRLIQAGRYIDVGGGITMPVKDYLLMLDASAGKVPGTSMKPNISFGAGLRKSFNDGGPAEEDALRVAQEVMTDPMGVAAVAAIEQQPADARPGLYEKLTDILSSPFRTYAEKTKEAAQSGSSLMSESAKSLRGEDGRLAVNALWQYPLGAASTVLSPLTGAAETVGEGVAQATGNKAIGERAGFVAGFVGPGQPAKTATRISREVMETPAPKLMDVKPASIDLPAAKVENIEAAVPQTKELNYVTRQDGPFYRVRSSSIEESGPAYRRSGEDVPDDLRAPGSVERGGAGPVGDGAPQSLTPERLSEILEKPELNQPLQSAQKYVQERGLQFAGRPEMPPSSLAKQSAIGRAYQLAVDGTPEYKQAVFDAYKREMPEVIEQSGARNYDELVAASYRQMAKETSEQFDALPLNYSFHRAGEGDYPSSAEMVRDVHGNRHLYVFQGGDRHEFLHNVDPRTGLNENEKFRAVHDAFGHAIYGNKFGAPGEEVAWGIHQQMYSPLARLAMTSETRGQNSFVNYTPLNAALVERGNKLSEAAAYAMRSGDKERAARYNAEKAELYKNWQYAPQKAVLLPPEFTRLDYSGGMPDYLKPANQPPAGTAVASDLTHFSTQPDLSELDPARYGTGIKGDEASRLRSTPGAVKERSYFYTGTPDQVTPEEGLGPYKYVTRSEKLYDLTKDPLGFKTLAAEANRTPWMSNFNPGTVDRSRYANDLERLVKEYGYEGLTNPNAAFPMAITFEKTPVRRAEKRGGEVVDRALELTRHFGSDIKQVAKKVRT